MAQIVTIPDNLLAFPDNLLAFPDNSGCIWENEWEEHVVLTLAKTLRLDSNHKQKV